MKTIRLTSIQFFVLFFVFMVPLISAQTLDVTRTDDPTPNGCNSGTDCSLREAIIAANDVGSGTVTIQLTGGQTYTLSIENPNYEDDLVSPDEAAGSLKVLNSNAKVRIEATGSGMATINANDIDRVFIIYSDTDVEINEIEITGGNPESGSGGGIMVFNNDNLMITNSQITGNTAINSSGFGSGGGIRAMGVNMTITGTTISNNEAGFQGGGLYITRYNEEVTVAGDVTIQNSIITNNNAGEWSGGIHTQYSDLTIIGSTISENQSDDFSGGIHVSSGDVVIDRSAIINNDVMDDSENGGLGGGIGVGNAEILIINSTISGNATGSSGYGGAIRSDNFSNGTVNIVNSTITNNSSWLIGGIQKGTSTFNVSNSIIANQAEGDDCSEALTSNGYNLESETSCGFTETGDLQNLDPFLGPLQDNGGPVFTHALSVDPLSPAINSGSNTLYTNAGGNLGSDSDANGNDRVYDFGSGGIIDIGAFELQQEGTVVGCPVTHEDKILFVKKGESGTGANWSNALGELRDALALFEDETCTTDDVEEIWVTAGTYLPTDDSGNREATFLMPGVNIYGGFEGDETNESQRDVESNTTVLSGEINSDNNLSGNSYHVVTSMDEESGYLFDFTITGGNANGTAPHDKGGGLYASNGGISTSNVLFENNYAETAGGAAYIIETVSRISAAHPGFVRTIFRNNESGNDGGALALEDAESRITSVTFENNEANRYGGAIFMSQSAPLIRNVFFTSNHANSQGGAISTDSSSPELVNVEMTQNTARFNGGAIDHAYTGTLSLKNTTIYGNEAEETATEYSGNGGGIYNRNGAELYALNSIIWGNSAALAGNEIWNAGPSSAELYYSLYGNGEGDIVEGGGFTTENSLTTNPLFEDASGGDVTLSNTSAAINTGDPNTEMSDFHIFDVDEIDLAENPRVYDGDVDIIDMGAYEFQGEPGSSGEEVITPDANNILYVNMDVSGGNGSGNSWNNAISELADALLWARQQHDDDNGWSEAEPLQIWIAEGAYLPQYNAADGSYDENGGRSNAFVMIPNVELYGGFNGTESDTGSRDLEAHETILSGDFNNDDNITGSGTTLSISNNDENAYHVVISAGEIGIALLNGVTITGGNANESGSLTVNEMSISQISGGGMNNEDSSPILTNVMIMGNSATNGAGVFNSGSSSPVLNDIIVENNSASTGGGIFNTGNSSPALNLVTITGNSATTGGGMYNTGSNAPVLTNVTIADNSASNGAGMVNANNSSPELSYVIISDNSASSLGGGMYNNTSSSPNLINVTITGNSAGTGGGGMFNTGSSSPVLTHVTIVDNSATTGGGMYNTSSTPALTNSIVWGEIYNDTESGLNANYSLFYWDDVDDENLGADENIDADNYVINEVFTDPSNGDYNLAEGSPAINAGSNQAYTDAGGDLNNDVDLAGNARLHADTIDMGAYEFQGDPGGSELAIPTLSSPSDEATDVTLPVTLTWNSASGAESYQVQVVTESGSFDTPDFDDETTETDIEVTGLAESTDYKWRVRSLTSEDESEWSAVWTFITTGSAEGLSAPTLSSPSDEATDVDRPITLVWNTVSGADTYDVQVALGSGSFASPVFNDETADTEAEITGLDESTEYMWRIRAKNSETESVWSNVWSFTTGEEPAIPLGEDQRILVGNVEDYIFAGADFAVSDEDYSIKIESLPDEGTLLFEENPVNLEDEISIEDINEDKLTWDMPEGEYGYNYTSFDFRIVNDLDVESEESYSMTIDLAAAMVELTGGEGWRFLTSPTTLVDPETVGSFLESIWTQGFTGSDSPAAQFVNVQMLDQENYQWAPAENSSASLSSGKPFIVYVYSDDENDDNPEGFPKTLTNTVMDWPQLSDGFSSVLDYDPAQTAEDYSFYLQGNPFPISFDYCETGRTEIANNVDVWDPSANSGNGDYVNLSCDLGDVHISPHQSFWLRISDSGNSFVIDEDAYLETKAGGYFKQSSNKEDLFLVSLDVTSEDQTFRNSVNLLFSDEGTAGLDPVDAIKISPAGLSQKWISFYSLDDKNRSYALQSLPKNFEDKVSIPLDIQTTQSGRFILKWTLPKSQLFNGSYFLRDNKTGEVIELQDGGSYSFEIVENQALKSTNHPKGEISVPPSDRSKRSDGSEPRFELLIAGDGIDGLTELGAIPEDFTLAQNYPNPFNPTTVISYQLPVSSQVRLEVYDMIGRRVAELVNGQIAAGRHTVNFNASGLSSGIYLYRLQAGNQIMTKKLTVVK